MCGTAGAGRCGLSNKNLNETRQKKMTKRLIALLLALVLCVGVLAACGPKDDPTTESNKGNESTGTVTEGPYVKPDLTGVKITYYAPDDTDVVMEDTWLDSAIEKYLGLDLEIVEGADLTGLYAAKKAPELLYLNAYSHTDIQLGEDGAFINIYDYLDKMPNVKKYLEDPANAANVAKYTVSEGVMYYLPITQNGGNAGKYAFLYRKDIFEANNLKFPTNQNEFVDTLKKLKEIYPDSMPFVMRNMTKHMQGAQAFGHLWGGIHLLMGNYNTIFTLDADGKYYLGATSNAYKEMAQFFKELTDQGLMHQSSMTIGTTDWYTAMGNGKSFITYDKVDRLPDMNKNIKALNPDAVCVAGAPFNFGTYAKTATVVSTSFAAAATGYAYGIGETANKENVMKYVDWLYSEEGQIFTNYGIENESYKVVDGKIDFIDSFLEAQGGLKKAGLWCPWLSGVTDFKAYIASADETIAESLEVAAPYEFQSPTQVALQYNDVEKLVWDTFATSAYNYALAEFSKFILGQRDFATWDDVNKELETTYHLKELLQIHESALARVK